MEFSVTPVEPSGIEPTVAEAAAAALPVAVEHYGTDYVDLGWINISGSSRDGGRWHLMIACSCTFDSPDFSWNSDDETSSLEVAQRLVGAQLIRVDVDDSLLNPVFHFSGDARITVFAGTGLDPWVLTLPGMPWVLVGVSQDSPAN